MASLNDSIHDRQPYPVGDSTHGQLVQANKPLPIEESHPVWAAFASITVSTSVVNLGANRHFNRAYISIESNPIRYTVDGSLPTASVGHLASAGDIIKLDSFSEVFEFQTIRQGAADATLMVSFGNI